MLTRRRMLAGAGLSANSALAQSAKRENAAPDARFAHLKRRRDEAKPITVEERRERIERAHHLMTEGKLDAIGMIGGTSLVYFTNIHWWNSERFFAMVMPARGEPFYVCPAFEEARAREQIASGPGGSNAQVLTWQEDEDPYKLFAQGLKQRGLATSRLGMEEEIPFVFADGIAKAAPSLTISSATPVTAGCRQIKSAHEIELMRLASHVTLEAYEAAWKLLRDGMTQNEFAGLVSAAHDKLGFQGGAGVQVGEYSANPHGSRKPQVIRQGAILLIDGGCKVEGYQSDISRTFVLGKPTDKMQRVFEIVDNAQATALKTARPGVACEAVDHAARQLIEEAGFGPRYRYFTHRVGHGIGLDGHEWPYLVRGNRLPLQAHMTLSDEPGIYIPGEFGVRLEDDMHITEDGAELFTPQSPSLEHPFGG
ncbi:MAG: aminopeptidase P family protein [Acidobacteria bacterium]|nr:MAG: aminopeptidase P family protein [Acidobacteriota bacterium]